MTKESTRYRLTPDSALFLDRKSPAYLGSALGFLHAPKFTEAFQNLTDAVRKGGTASEAGTVAPEHPLWVDFAKSMIPLMAKPAEEIALLAQQIRPRSHGYWTLQRGMGSTESKSRDVARLPKLWRSTGLMCSPWRRGWLVRPVCRIATR